MKKGKGNNWKYDCIIIINIKWEIVIFVIIVKVVI